MIKSPAIRKGILSSKNKLHQQHIAHGARADAEQGVALPQVEQRHHGAADTFRDTEGGGSEADVLQTVYHQHAHDGEGEHPAQIGDDGGCLPVLTEDQKGQEPQRHGDQGGHGDDEGGVEIMHGHTSCASKSGRRQ